MFVDSKDRRDTSGSAFALGPSTVRVSFYPKAWLLVPCPKYPVNRPVNDRPVGDQTNNTAARTDCSRVHIINTCSIHCHFELPLKHQPAHSHIEQLLIRLSVRCLLQSQHMLQDMRMLGCKHDVTDNGFGSIVDVMV